MAYDHNYDKLKQTLLRSLLKAVHDQASAQCKELNSEDIPALRKKWIEASFGLSSLLFRPYERVLDNWNQRHEHNQRHHGYVLLPDTDPPCGWIAGLTIASQGDGPVTEMGFHMLLIHVDDVIAHKEKFVGLYYRVESPHPPGANGEASNHNYPHLQLSQLGDSSGIEDIFGLMEFVGDGPTVPVPASCAIGLFLAALKTFYNRRYHEMVASPHEVRRQISELDQFSL